MDERFPLFTPPQSDTEASQQLRRCKLVREGEAGASTEFIFDQPVILLGSLADSDLVIDDDSISRSHARVRNLGDRYAVEDLGSTNGTFVNGVRVREAFLHTGCRLSLGKVELRFHAMDERVEISPSHQEAFGEIVGRSPRMREIFAVLSKIAPTEATVVIEGETGTGKEVVARAMHERSPRRKGPFVVVDCGAVPESLIESELFGHERGSFTGALASRKGLFQLADGGTLFLDEIGELSLELQPKLLRALERREVRAVGANRTETVDVRVLAATHRDLETMVREGRFREDLFYRLSVVRLRMPSLRERKDDIPLLVKHFLRSGRYNRDAEGRPRVQGLSRDALDALIRHDWPGNVRELINVIERACSFADGDTVQTVDLPAQITIAGAGARRENPEAPTLPDKVGGEARKAFKDAKERWVSSFERDYVLSVLRRNQGNISHAARDADIDRKYFRKLMKKYDIVAEDDEG